MREVGEVLGILAIAFRSKRARRLSGHGESDEWMGKEGGDEEENENEGCGMM